MPAAKKTAATPAEKGPARARSAKPKTVKGPAHDHVKAIVRDPIAYTDGGACRQAPCGEYEVEHRAGCIGLCSCASHNAFTLSFDAFLQHLNEGRIALVA